MGKSPSDSGRTVESRTSASAGPSCSECGDSITGRRRNGFCSDKCRLRTRRAERTARFEELLEDIETAVTKLRHELRSAIDREDAESGPT